jgi:hypothetical protein
MLAAGAAAPEGVTIEAAEETESVRIAVGDESAIYERVGFTLTGDWVCEWVARNE